MTLPVGLEREIGYATGLTPTFGSNMAVAIDDSGEQNLDLTWPYSVPVYHKMRTDPKIGEILRALTLPIRGARRYLDPNGAPAEVVQHVATDLGLRVKGQPDKAAPRSRGRFSLDEHLRLALLSLVYGHAPFEQTYRIDTAGPKPLAHLAKLGLRHPLTIHQIEVARDGGLVSLTQNNLWFGQMPVTPPTPITVDRLVWYANDREGGAWQGRSLLREAYGPWRRKDDALRTWLTSLRRNGIGQPVYHGAPNETAEQLRAGALLAQRSRAGETSGLGVPNGASMTWQGVQGTLPDHEHFVRYCDEEIASNVLAEFLKLGSTRAGARSLGETFIDFFTLCDQAISDELVRTLNEHVIEDLVDLNWGEDMPAPRLVLEDVGSEHTLTAQTMSLLLTSGALSADPSLEAYMRETFKLPQRDPSSPWADPKTPTVIPSAPEPPAPAPVSAAVGSTSQHRSGYPQERFTDFDALQSEWQNELALVLAAYLPMRSSQAQSLAQQIRDAAGNLSALTSLAIATAPVSAAVADSMTRMWRTAADRMVAEAAAQGITITAPAPDEVWLQQYAMVSADSLGASLSTSAEREAARRDGLDPDSIGDEVEAFLEGLTDAQPADVLGGALTAAQNRARMTTVGDLTNGLMYASEVLDRNTCAACAAIDGTVFGNVLDALGAYPTGGYVSCAGRERCRGTVIWLADPTVES